LVCSWIKPAIAMEPPDGISSVVSARRVLIEGTVSELPFWFIVMALSLDSSDTRSYPQADPAFSQDDRGEIERDTEFLS